ncbi:hypothetical protein ETD83_16335 [Actinomadura soli]|uniref:Uncharacterized protein n=1 Tax=Actinomadura soli TaxID=2508997 RepID=A0A5C4JDA8_9ACTN|nr:hypothetical protein [Actinomadura soli]TMR00617.1 hypothetical protein ETD83_16335 [Actinomadura soli]
MSEPVTRPAAEIIDHDRRGRRVGDGRPFTTFTPYAARTHARIRTGLERFWWGHGATERHDDEFALVVPVGRNAVVRTSQGPITTIATRAHHGIVWPGDTVDDCHYRLITPREQMLAQRFPADYALCGTVEQQHAQVCRFRE